MSEHELDEVLTFWWPMVLRRAMGGADEWQKNFCRSIARHGKRAAWRPTSKQAYLMRKLIADLSNEAEPQLIEAHD